MCLRLVATDQIFHAKSDLLGGNLSPTFNRLQVLLMGENGFELRRPEDECWEGIAV
jgi:hypothetical protein